MVRRPVQPFTALPPPADGGAVAEWSARQFRDLGFQLQAVHAQLDEMAAELAVLRAAGRP